MGKIRLCPKCKKPTLKNATNVSGWLAPDLYKCKDDKCGYVGRIYIELQLVTFLEIKRTPQIPKLFE